MAKSSLREYNMEPSLVVAKWTRVYYVSLSVIFCVSVLLMILYQGELYNPCEEYRKKVATGVSGVVLGVMSSRGQYLVVRNTLPSGTTHEILLMDPEKKCVVGDSVYKIAGEHAGYRVHNGEKIEVNFIEMREGCR